MSTFSVFSFPRIVLAVLLIALSLFKSWMVLHSAGGTSVEPGAAVPSQIPSILVSLCVLCLALFAEFFHKSQGRALLQGVLYISAFIFAGIGAVHEGKAGLKEGYKMQAASKRFYQAREYINTRVSLIEKQLMKEIQDGARQVSVAKRRAKDLKQSAASLQKKLSKRSLQKETKVKLERQLASVSAELTNTRAALDQHPINLKSKEAALRAAHKLIASVYVWPATAKELDQMNMEQIVALDDLQKATDVTKLILVLKTKDDPSESELFAWGIENHNSKAAEVFKASFFLESLLILFSLIFGLLMHHEDHATNQATHRAGDPHKARVPV